MGVSLSLWLVPDEPLRSRLAEFIRERASRLGTPAFAPHVTLLGGIGRDEGEGLARTRELARRAPPVPLVFARAAHAPAFYRCVVLEAEAAAELLGAHQRARRAMGRGPDRFQPHLSLVYGRLQERVRTGLAQEAARELALPLTATASRLELRDTGGPPVRWRLAGEFALEGR